MPMGFHEALLIPRCCIRTRISHPLRMATYVAIALLTVASIPISGTGQGQPGGNNTTDADSTRMVRARWEQFLSSGTSGSMKCTSINVYEDGRFRLERVHRDFPSMEVVEVYEGLLSEPQMNELRSVISDKDFAALHTSPAGWILHSDGQSLEAEVRRENGIQRFAIVNDGKSMIPSEVLPFMKWIGALKPDKSLRIKKAKSSMCVVAGSLP